jgi:GDP-D-mannose dehydratase
MSKNNQQKVEKAEIATPQGKTVEELKQIAQTLQVQLQEHQTQANHHQVMATKAQGAVEVMFQMIPKEEVEKMVAEEKQAENHQQNGQKKS